MLRSVKVSALLAIGLAILFFLFFEICKHAPIFSQVDVFTEDPYDSVGRLAYSWRPLWLCSPYSALFAHTLLRRRETAS